MFIMLSLKILTKSSLLNTAGVNATVVDLFLVFFPSSIRVETYADL